MRRDRAGLPLTARRGAQRARPFVVAAAGLGLLFAAAGCGGTSNAVSVSATITIAAVPGINDAPIWLAQRDRLFAAAGLTHVVIKSYATESAAITAVENRQADIAASDYGNIFYQQASQPNLKILADGYDAGTGVLEILTLPACATATPHSPCGSSVTSPEQLANQKVAVPDYDGLPNWRSMQQAGHPLSLDAAAATQVLYTYLGTDAYTVDWVPMSEQQEITELEDHQVRAILLSQPYIYQAESQFGAVEILDACSGSTANLPLSGYVALSVWAKDNPSAVADFQAALAKAQTDASMFGPVQQLLPGIADMSKQDADLATIGVYPTTTSASELERVSRLMNDLSMISVGTSDRWSGAIPPMIVRH